MVFVRCFTPSVEYVYHILIYFGCTNVTTWGSRASLNISMINAAGRDGEKAVSFQRSMFLFMKHTQRNLILGYFGVDSHILYIYYIYIIYMEIQ
jgi:hypothetical protein